MVRRNLLPLWYPAACHRDNIQWGVVQWVDALSVRGRLVRAEIDGKLDVGHLEAVVTGSIGFLPAPATRMVLSVDVSQPNTVLLRNFLSELEAVREQSYPPVGSGICQNVAHHRGKFKLFSFMDGLNRLHRLRVLDWIDLSLWSRLSGVSLEAGYLGDIFWPDEEIDRRYRLVTGTRPLACQLLNKSVICGLSTVCSDL